MLQFEFDFREPYVGRGNRTDLNAYMSADKPCQKCGSYLVYKSAYQNKKKKHRRCVPCQRKHSLVVSRRKAKNPVLRASVSGEGLTARQIRQKIRKQLRSKSKL